MAVKAVWNNDLFKTWVQAEMQNAPIKGRSINYMVMDDFVKTNRSSLRVRHAPSPHSPKHVHGISNSHRWRLFFQGDSPHRVSLSLTVRPLKSVEEQSPEEGHQWDIRPGQVWRTQPYGVKVTEVVEDGKLVCDLL